MGETASRRARHPAARLAIQLAGLLLAPVLGFSAALLVARWTSTPAWFLGAGLATVAAVAFAAVARTRPAGRFPVTAGLLAAAVLVALMGLAWLVPLSDPPAAPPAGVRYWQLPGGSRLGYLEVPAVRAAARPRPVVVLHGGPGIPDLSGDAAYWGQLSRLGFDVYVYAQLGAGPSNRLADPTGYRVDRDVSDLDEVRRQIGADRLILIGHSYGGYLAAAYLAAHPGHVERLVLTSPEPLNPSDHSGDAATARLTLPQRLRLYPSALQPRALLGYLLLQVNPSAAHRYFPDSEADARNDVILTKAAPGLQCAATNPPRVSGSGFYRLQLPQAAGAPPRHDLRPRLVGRSTPVLVLKGGCDYQSWTSVTDYRRALPHSTLVYLPDAGHNLHLDQPDAVMAVVSAALVGNPLPVAPYQGLRVPSDYQHT